MLTLQGAADRKCDWITLG